MNESDLLIKDVNEEMRRERVQQFMRSFGKYIVAVSGVIIVATIVYVIWQNHQQSTREDNTHALYMAIDMAEEQPEKAYAAFERIAQEHGTNTALLAQLWLTKLDHKAGRVDEAQLRAKALIAEHDDSALLAPYIDWLTLYLPVAEIDEVNLKKFGTYRLTNTERLAVDALKRKDYDTAAQHYHTILYADEAPATMRDRASTMLTTILADYAPETPATVNNDTSGGTVADSIASESAQ